MNSQNINSASQDKKQPSTQYAKTNPVDFTLTYDQYIMLQHYLPKKFTLLEYKSTKRNHGNSAVKNTLQENQNVSKYSGTYEKSQQIQGRSKRNKPKKIDRYLQNDLPTKIQKRTTSQKLNLNLDEDMLACYHILTSLKKYKNAYPFLKPVNPEYDGAYNYLDVIKEPMDLSTIQNNLKNGEYQTAGQFHGDINKIWMNSYAYNDKSSIMYKITADVEKYYKNLCANGVQPISKKSKTQQKAKNKERKSKLQYQVSINRQKSGKSPINQVASGGRQEYGIQSNEFFYGK